MKAGKIRKFMVAGLAIEVQISRVRQSYYAVTDIHVTVMVERIIGSEVETDVPVAQFFAQIEVCTGGIKRMGDGVEQKGAAFFEISLTVGGIGIVDINAVEETAVPVI